VGWPGTAAGLAATLSPLDLLELDARVDSALLWALTLNRLRSGATPDEALAAVIGLLDVAQVSGRFNFLLTDGQMIAATAAGHSLWYRHTSGTTGGSVTVASEPADDDPGWTEVPDRSLLAATTANVAVRPLEVPAEVTADTAEGVRYASFPHGMAPAFPHEVAASDTPNGRNPGQ